MLPISAGLTFILSRKKRPPRRRLEPRLGRRDSRAGRSVTPAPPAHSQGPQWERGVAEPRLWRPWLHPQGAPKPRVGGPRRAATHTWQLWASGQPPASPPHPFGPQRLVAGGWGSRPGGSGCERAQVVAALSPAHSWRGGKGAARVARRALNL